MNYIGIVVVGLAIFLFIIYCLMDAASRADADMERLNAASFARFETRGPGTTDVDDCAGKVCPCETACANGIERLR